MSYGRCLSRDLSLFWLVETTTKVSYQA